MRPPGPAVRLAGAIALCVAVIVLTWLAATRMVAGAVAVPAVAAVAGLLAWLAGTGRPGRQPATPPTPGPIVGIPQEFLDRLPDPLLLLNASREIVAVNAQAREVLGIGLLGRDLALSLRHPDVLAAVETLGLGIPTVTEEITLPGPVPRTFTLHAGDLPKTDDPAGARVVLLLRDETRAKRAEQSRADFVANASHELRSPLSALIGFIETLRGPASDDAVARERFLGVMEAEAQRMARLVDDLMSLSRVEINEHVPPRHRVHLADVLAAVAEALAVRAEGRGMTIDVDAPEDLPTVMGDTDQLNQVFHNLVANAVEYGRPGTTIRVTARAVDRLPGMQVAGVAVGVADQGEGIDAIHLPRLTERFYRADAGRSRRLGGTGLGLAIVKHIVNRHRGRLSIESRVGVGSTFTVHLPAAEGAIATNPKAKTAPISDSVIKP